MDILDNILKYRDLKNLSDPQLAEILDVDRSLIGKWESGKSYPQVDLPPLAVFFGVALELYRETSCLEFIPNVQIQGD